MSHLLTTAPGPPALLDQLFAAKEKRINTPTSQCVAQAMPEGERTPSKPGFELSPEVIALVDEQSQYFVDHIQRRDRPWTEGMDVFRSRHD